MRRTMTLILTISKVEIGLHDFNVAHALNKTMCFVICFEYLRLSIQECYQNEILPEQSMFCKFLF